MSVSKLFSWGHYPYAPPTGSEPGWRESVQPVLLEAGERFGTTVPFGNGRSYADSCLAATDHVLALSGLDRFIAANWKTGVVRPETGVTLGKVLVLAVPRGWMLPGTQFVTLGGAVTNDVHGKNHHVRGTFGRHVRRLLLLRSDREPLEYTPEENTKLYCATIGGLGLDHFFEEKRKLIPLILKKMRVHQWVKNVLIFVPLLTADRFMDPSALSAVCIAFVSFSVAASSVYLLNDMIDLDADRRHAPKRGRPFASGRLSLKFGIVLTVVLLAAGGGLAALLP